MRAAWQLEPVRRQELFAEPALATLAARPAIFPLFELGNPEEPRVPPAGARRPIALPAGTSAATCGQSLRLMVGSAELLVPGGALLAPDDAVLENAEAWSRHGEARAMAALPSLMASAAAGESLSPRRLRLSEEAGGVLAEQNQPGQQREPDVARRLPDLRRDRKVLPAKAPEGNGNADRSRQRTVGQGGAAPGALRHDPVDVGAALVAALRKGTHKGCPYRGSSIFSDVTGH